MEFYLLENGINSLNLGVDFYNKFLDYYFDDKERAIVDYEYDKNSYLKLSVMCIHNSVEILSKKVLSDVNELLIYSDISHKSDLLDYIDSNRDNNNAIPLHNSLIADDSRVHTIEYLESIKRLTKIFNLNERILGNLERLGHIRNQIIHFGISKPVDVHTILGIINRSLEFITDFFLDERGLLDKDSSSNVFRTFINGCEIEENLWRNLFNDKFATLVKLIEESIELINSEYGKETLSFNVHLDSEIWIEKADKSLFILTQNHPIVDSTVLLNINPEDDFEHEILGIIDHTESEYVYIPKKCRLIESIFHLIRNFGKVIKRIITKWR